MHILWRSHSIHTFMRHFLANGPIFVIFYFSHTNHIFKCCSGNLRSWEELLSGLILCVKSFLLPSRSDLSASWKMRSDFFCVAPTAQLGISRAAVRARESLRPTLPAQALLWMLDQLLGAFWRGSWSRVLANNSGEQAIE